MKNNKNDEKEEYIYPAKQRKEGILLRTSYGKVDGR